MPKSLAALLIVAMIEGDTYGLFQGGRPDCRQLLEFVLVIRYFPVRDYQAQRRVGLRLQLAVSLTHGEPTVDANLIDLLAVPLKIEHAEELDEVQAYSALRDRSLLGRWSQRNGGICRKSPIGWSDIRSEGHTYPLNSIRCCPCLSVHETVHESFTRFNPSDTPDSAPAFRLPSTCLTPFRSPLLAC